MIGIVISAVLVIQTYDHQTKLATDLSDAGCDAARCLAQFGTSCIAHAAQQVLDHKWRLEREAYLKAHPPKSISCGKGCTTFSVDTMGSSEVRSMSATETAMCVE